MRDILRLFCSIGRGSVGLVTKDWRGFAYNVFYCLLQKDRVKGSSIAITSSRPASIRNEQIHFAESGSAESPFSGPNVWPKLVPTLQKHDMDMLQLSYPLMPKHIRVIAPDAIMNRNQNRSTMTFRSVPWLMGFLFISTGMMALG